MEEEPSNNNNSNEALNHLYSCSRWAGYDPEKVLENFITGEKKAYAYMKKHFPVEEDIPYGAEENQKVDVWGTVGDKMFIFIHGGYWQEGDRKHILSPAVHLTKHMAFASVGYTLASQEQSISHPVQDVIAAVEFLINRYPAVEEFIVGGHSAGAHLAFQAAVKLHHPKIKKLVLLAAIYKLKELVSCEIGKAIGLTAEEAERYECSPYSLCKLDVELFIMTALKDAPRLVEQNKMMYSAMKMPNRPIFHELLLCDHFNMITRFQSKKSESTQFLFEFLGLKPKVTK